MRARQRRQSAEEESIYDLIPQPVVRAARPMMHRSKFPHDTPPTASTFGSATVSQVPMANLGGHYQDMKRVHRHTLTGGTMGPRNLHYSDPTSFLKKQSQPTLPEARRFNYTSTRKDALVTKARAMSSPAMRESKKRRVTPKKNFVAQNALAVINAEPRRPKTNDVNYIKKQDYGKSPAYLKRVNREIQLETEYIRRVMEREQQEVINRHPQMRQLPEAERSQLLNDLKTKWASVNSQYQIMTHHELLDTIGKIRRKEQFESQLKQLESSIEKLSRPVVYVQDEQ